MRFLDAAACGRWSARLGSVDPADAAVAGEEEAGWGRAPGSIENLAASRQMWLAEWTVRWLFERDPSEALIWVKQTGVFNENLFLYRLLRRKHLSVDGVDQTPGHLFGRDEREDGVALLFLAMVNGWDVLVVSRYGDRCVHVSHDGLVNARGRSAEERAKFLGSVPK